MKPFFGKQVIEQPRSGSRARSLKMRDVGRIVDGEYDGPTRIPMSMGSAHRFNKKLHEKSFTDTLGPVRRYLAGKVGHHWDDVFSELSKALGSGSYPIRHVLYDHILTRRSGFPTAGENGPLSFWGDGCYYYVNENGLVSRRLESWRGWNRKKDDPRKVDIGDGEHLVWIEGIWYIGKWVKRLAPMISVSSNCRVVDLSSWPDNVDYVFVKRKQANKKEIAKHRPAAR